MIKNVMVFLSLLLLFVGLNVVGLYYGDEPTPDVDGRWNGFTEAELMEGYDG